MFVRVQVVVVLVSSLYTVKAFSFEGNCIYAQNYDVKWCCTTHVRTPTIYPTLSHLSRSNGTRAIGPSQILLLCIYIKMGVWVVPLALVPLAHLNYSVPTCTTDSYFELCHWPSCHWTNSKQTVCAHTTATYFELCHWPSCHWTNSTHTSAYVLSCSAYCVCHKWVLAMHV